MIKTYYSLIKPGVLYGNVITGIAGFLFASNGQYNSGLFLATILGMSLIIASACVLNNYLDRDIDRIMERTKNRAVASGKVPGLNAVIFSAVLGVAGLIMLILWTNFLVVMIGIIGFFDYVLLYGVLTKRMSIHGTLVGSISGAMPILAGYVAVSGQIDIGAVLVFLVLFLWQMPEFYSISIYRHDEYKAAGVNVMSVVKGIDNTKIQILIYTIAFVTSTLLLWIFGYTGITYLVVMSALGGYWIFLGINGLKAKDVNVWSKKMFRFSLIILLIFCLLISVNALLP